MNARFQTKHTSVCFFEDTIAVRRTLRAYLGSRCRICNVLGGRTE